jgi:hypothetical protein
MLCVWRVRVRKVERKKESQMMEAVGLTFTDLSTFRRLLYRVAADLEEKLNDCVVDI